MVTMTLEEARKRKLPKREIEQLKKLAAVPDEEIDTSDLPEFAGLTGGVRGRFYRPVTQSVTIRLNAPDVDAARRLSRLKGMPYQTYIKSLLHEALVREARLALAGASRKTNNRS
jgi:predicted DNA binding CopG/RHH family protein